MRKKLRVDWLQQGSGIGNAYGYSTMGRNQKKYAAELIDIRTDADIAFQINTADAFRPVEGKFNILSTMYESESIPASFAAGINTADAIIVTSNHNKRVFRPYTDKPIYVCNLGCNTDLYYFQDREFPRIKPFRFLWVGAPNPRKGWQEIVLAWHILGAAKDKGVELYFKTTMGEQHGKKENVTFDSRNMSLKELVALYHSSHCFVFPTRGEGWGLTLNEAMSTGLPCIATQYSGCADFFDSYTGYPIDYIMDEFHHRQYNLHTDMASPKVEHLAYLMSYVFNNYKEARGKGRKAAQRIRHKFTWKHSAERLVEVLNDINEKYVETGNSHSVKLSQSSL
jgi:glycosyltransferase involved in cell wall biosynthesis